MPTPQEVDTALADLYYAEQKLLNRRAGCVIDLLNAAGAKWSYQGRQRVVDITEAEALERIASMETQDRVDQAMGKPPLVRGLNRAIKAVESLRDINAEITANRRAQADLEDQYTGWSRFFLVTSSQGHVHSSMSCSTCYPTTTYGWLPELSGSTEAEAVKRCGPSLCSVCFPSAPVGHQDGYLSEAQAADILAGKSYVSKEDRKAAKEAERKAKADAKALRAYERAKKLMVKVEAAHEELGGPEGIAELPGTGDGSLYDLAYRDNGLHKRYGQTVVDILFADDREAREGYRSSYDKDPREIIREYEAEHQEVQS